MAWSKYYGKGRVFYRNLGHHIHVWKDPRFQEHILGGIYWALNIGDAGDAKIDIGHKKIDSEWTPLFDDTLDFGVDWETSDDPAQTRKHWTALPGNVLQGYCDESDPVGSSHLYYTKWTFKNFEYRVDININQTGNSGLYFRCPKDDNYIGGLWKNFPRGLEAQINNAYEGDPKKSGTFYPKPALSVEDIRKFIGYGTIPDYGHFWFHMHVIAVDNHFVVKLNGNVVIDLHEPKDSKRYCEEGDFAFQLHHAETRVRFKNVEVRELP